MLFLLGFLLLAVFCLSVLIRAFLLFPLRALRHGGAPALRRYGLSLLLCVTVLLWQLGALYGFSWQQLGRADRGQMLDAAVAFAYPEAYADLDELRSDYAHFRPEVLYWGSRNDQIIEVMDKLLGRTEYQIRLPDLMVIADIHGRPLYHFPPDEEQQVIPDRPILGLVGDIQDLREAAPVNETLGLRWSNPQYGEAEIHDNCFSAFSPLSREQHLELTSSGAEPLRMGRPLGYFRVQVQLGQRDGGPSNSASRQRISYAEFLQERQACRARAAASVSAPRE